MRTTTVGAIGLVGVIALSACSGGSHRANPSDRSPLVDVSKACDSALDAEIPTVRALLGTSQVTLGPTIDQNSLQKMATQLTNDAAVNGAMAGSRSLCSVRPKSSQALLSITFQWKRYNGTPAAKVASSEASTEYDGTGYVASSQDDQVVLDFFCRIPHAGENDGRNLYLSGFARTDGLGALPRNQKREAQLRVLHAASVKVAAAMNCSTALPKTLGTLKPEPTAT